MTLDAIAHREEGLGPDVLLLNGIMMSVSAWDPVVDAIRSRYRVTRTDFRGQLLSPGTPPATIVGHARDVARLLDHLGRDRVHIAGTSFGGMVGLAFSAMFPDRVKSLTAMTTTHRMTAEMWQMTEPLLEAVTRAAAGGNRAAVFDTIVPATFSSAWRTSQQAALAQRRLVVASLPAYWFTGLAGLLRAVRDVDLTELLPRIACPVHVVGADADLMFGPACSRIIATSVRAGRLTMIPGAAHGFVVEDPLRAAALIDGFVSEIENRWIQAAR